MKSNYQHIFTPLTVKNMTNQKPYRYDAYGNQLRGTERRNEFSFTLIIIKSVPKAAQV